MLIRGDPNCLKIYIGIVDMLDRFVMDVWEPRPQRIHSQPDLNVLKPKDNLNIFLGSHECTDMNICDQNCIELETCMRYTKNEYLI